jgi:tetratricopeptide (TPR) repeat protein
VRLRALRLSAELSQEELAERSGLSVRTIGGLERGHIQRPYPVSVRRLADALGLGGPARDEFVSAARRRLAAGQPAARAEPTAGASSPGGAGPVLPRQLPVAVSAFVGRLDELATLTQLLRPPGGTAVITALGGTAGVGKTALAVQWAHQFATEFPDGQLFVNLRGFDPSGVPVAPADAVRVLLDALQVPADRLPQTVEAQFGLYRSLLAGKRMLLILDNACDVAQVRPLLPGSPACRVIVTSRNLLTGLAAVEAAQPLLLDVLTPPEARQLLQRRLGAARLAAEPGAATQIMDSCARLPLALSIVAARAAMRPDLPLAQIASDVTAGQNLDAFTSGDDPAADVRAVLSWSYRELDASTARAFRLAGLAPGPSLDRYAAAALTGSTARQAGRALDALARAGLALPTGPDRYGMHDLLRSYARELTASGTAGDEAAALTRLLDYYLHTASAAVDTLFPARRYRHPQIPAPDTPVPVITSEAAARAWLDTHRSSLVATAVHAANNGWPSHASRLSAVLFNYLLIGAHYPEAITVHHSASRAARSAGDKAAEAEALNSLSAVDFQLGRYQQAASHLSQSIAAYQQAGNEIRLANVYSNLGFVEFREGNCEQAICHLEESLAVLRTADDPVGEAVVLNNLGFAALRQGRYQQATDYLNEALGLFRQTGEMNGAAHALSNLGEAALRQGRYQQATSQLQQALGICRQTSDRTNEADMLTLLGIASLRRGHYQQATSHLEQALALCQQTDSMSAQAAALNGLGELLSATGRPDEARAQHAAALAAASHVGEKYEQARAHLGLARAYQASGDTGKARHHSQQALTYYTELGAPEAGQIHAQLAPVSTRRARLCCCWRAVWGRLGASAHRTETRRHQARRLLHDGTLDTSDRMAGLLVLLYAQTPTAAGRCLSRGSDGDPRRPRAYSFAGDFGAQAPDHHDAVAVGGPDEFPRGPGGPVAGNPSAAVPILFLIPSDIDRAAIP